MFDEFAISPGVFVNRLVNDAQIGALQRQFGKETFGRGAVRAK